VPVGFYVVRRENGSDIIRQCNSQFAEMFKFKSMSEVKGFDIRKLYSKGEDYYAFREAIRDCDRRGLPLLGFPLGVRDLEGKEFTIEVNSRLLRDRAGPGIAFTKFVRYNFRLAPMTRKKNPMKIMPNQWYLG